MSVFHIFRMKENARQQFRWAPHSSGATAVKPRDYEPAETVEADSVYDAWHALKGGEKPLEVGDVLEIEGGGLRIYKYVGFEEAHWVLPEPKPGPESVPAEPGQPVESGQPSQATP